MSASPLTDAPQRGRVLAVDDEPGMRRLMRLTLERAGYDVACAATLEEAIEAAEAREADVLLVDYRLNGTSTGLDVLHQLRERGCDLPAILVTAFSDEQRILEALRTGVRGVIPKTAGFLDYLPDAVAAVLTQRRAEQTAAEAARARQSEEYFRRLADSLPQLVWTALPDGRVDYYNRRHAEFTGVAAEGAGWNWEPTVHPEDLQRTREAWQRAVATGAVYEIEHRVMRADGDYQWFVSRAVPFRDDEGRILRWYGTATDIDALKQAQQTLERANTLKDQFLATLSHELRTPLNAILGWTQILTTRPQENPTRVRQILGTIARNAQMQVRLIEDLLDMSRIASGTLRLELQPVDLGLVVQSVLDSIAPMAEAKQVGMSVVPEAAQDVQALGDPARLQQVIWNLVANAVKFTPPGGHVEVTIEAGDGTLRVVVTDTGPGIPVDFLPFIFDAFRQADATPSRAQGGLGLGLSIARQLVDLHGGTIQAENVATGGGARFTVTLPLVASEWAVRPLPRAVWAASAEGADQAADLSGIRILAVDDEADARALVARILTDRGAEVVLADSADSALERLDVESFHVMLVDIAMPGKSGFDVAASVRAHRDLRTRTMPLVALTAYAGGDDRERAMAAGFTVHATKPISPAALTAIVCTLTQRTPSA